MRCWGIKLALTRENIMALDIITEDVMTTVCSIAICVLLVCFEREFIYLGLPHLTSYVFIKYPKLMFTCTAP